MPDFLMTLVNLHNFLITALIFGLEPFGWLRSRTEQ